MSPSQAIGYTLAQTTAVTTIVSTRIYNGTRPTGTTVPCINYFEVGGRKRSYGFERIPYSINCRAATAETALQLAKLVDDIFMGSSGTGVYGAMNSFEFTRSFVNQNQGLVPEVEDNLYNAPVDIFLVCPTGSIT